MGKMILLFCLLAGSGKGGWRIPQPSIISLDIVGAQFGPAFGGLHDYPHISLGAYIGQLRGYWGKTFSLSLGLDAFRWHTSFWKDHVWVGPSGDEDEYYVPVNPMSYVTYLGFEILEVFSLHVGIALLAPPDSTGCCCIGGMFTKKGYSPRLELYGSVSFINFGDYGVDIIDMGGYEVEQRIDITFSPSFLFGLNVLLFRSASMLLRNRWFSYREISTLSDRYSFDLSLVFNLGGDIIGTPREQDSTKLHYPAITPAKPKRKYKAYLYEYSIVQTSCGADLYSGEILFPTLTISLMDLRLYPERNVPLFFGIEFARLYWGNTLDSTASNKILSALSPRFGLVIFMEPRASLRSKWIGMFKDEHFIPRVEFSTSTNLINLENPGGSNWQPASGSLGMFAVTRTEIRWKFSATMSIQAEHRFRFLGGLDHSFGLSLSVALGKDNIRTEKEDE